MNTINLGEYKEDDFDSREEMLEQIEKDAIEQMEAK